MQFAPKNFYKKLLGRSGEKSAEKYLKKKGYVILERNYTTKIGEIDLIARDKNTLVFIEVKTRRDDSYGSPSEAVGDFKKRKYYKVATEYLVRNSLTDSECRFDVVEVLGKEINHISDAFSV